VAVPQLRFLAAALLLLGGTRGSAGLSGVAQPMRALTIFEPLSTITIRVVTVNLLQGRKWEQEILQNFVLA